MKQVNYICHNKKEFINLQLELFKNGYFWGSLNNNSLINIEKVKKFEKYPVIINCNAFADYRMTYDVRYHLSKHKHRGEYIDVTILLRKIKLNKIKWG